MRTRIRERICLHSGKTKIHVNRLTNSQTGDSPALSHTGYSTGPRLILAWSAGMPWSSKGTLPHTSTYNTTPKLRTSTSTSSAAKKGSYKTLLVPSWVPSLGIAPERVEMDALTAAAVGCLGPMLMLTTLAAELHAAKQ